MASTIPWHEWLNLLLRWFHLVAGIMWIGSSFYFIWLDSHLEAPEPKNDKIEGSLWMVHSGGFYTVEKRYIAPGEMPKTLHWFKWEATFT
ncbi:MAG: urate hydroxylase PuuD, partial [Bdellovibrionota bacterium]